MNTLDKNSQYAQYANYIGLAHYGVAVFSALFACFPIGHLAIGVGMVSGRLDTQNDPEAAFVGWLFIGIASTMMCLGWLFTAVLLYTGRCWQRKQHYTFCLIVAGVSCLFTPFGTILGVFALILLLQPEGKALFEPSTNAQNDVQVL